MPQNPYDCTSTRGVQGLEPEQICPGTDALAGRERVDIRQQVEGVDSDYIIDTGAPSPGIDEYAPVQDVDGDGDLDVDLPESTYDSPAPTTGEMNNRRLKQPAKARARHGISRFGGLSLQERLEAARQENEAFARQARQATRNHRENGLSL